MRVPERDSNPMEGGQLPLAVRRQLSLRKGQVTRVLERTEC